MTFVFPTNTLEEIASMLVRFGIYFLPIFFSVIFYCSPVRHSFNIDTNRCFSSLGVLTPSNVLSYVVSKNLFSELVKSVKYFNA